MSLSSHVQKIRAFPAFLVIQFTKTQGVPVDTKTILSVDAFMGWCLIAVTVISTIYATYLFLLACSIYIILLIPDNNLRFRLGKISAFIAGILGCLTMIPLGGIVYVMFFTAIPPLTV